MTIPIVGKLYLNPTSGMVVEAVTRYPYEKPLGLPGPGAVRWQDGQVGYRRPPDRQPQAPGLQAHPDNTRPTVEPLQPGGSREVGVNSTPSLDSVPGTPAHAVGTYSRFPPVLDAACGSKMFWFDRDDPRALFVDKRRETLVADTREGRREIVINPDLVADFKNLPFPDSTFTLVVFDPPHTFSGESGYMAKKYGRLAPGWREEIQAGFAECFRVLVPNGTLVFKWNEHRVSLPNILSLTPEKPLFGQRNGRTTHWIVFMKGTVAS